MESPATGSARGLAQIIAAVEYCAKQCKEVSGWRLAAGGWRLEAVEVLLEYGRDESTGELCRTKKVSRSGGLEAWTCFHWSHGGSVATSSSARARSKPSLCSSAHQPPNSIHLEMDVMARAENQRSLPITPAERQEGSRHGDSVMVAVAVARHGYGHGHGHGLPWCASWCHAIYSGRHPSPYPHTYIHTHTFTHTHTHTHNY
jgi:hypothetical protein